MSGAGTGGEPSTGSASAPGAPRPARPIPSFEWALPIDDLRAQVIGQGGRLAQALRRVERLDVAAEQLAELWRWASYLTHVRGYRAASTVALYVEIVGRFFAYLRAKGWDYQTLQVQHFDTWQQWLAMAPGKHLAAVTRRLNLRAVRAFYEWRMRCGLGINCAEYAQAPRIARRKPRKYTRPQLKAMLESCAGHGPQQVRDRAMILLLLTTGARREECAEITLDQLELRANSGIVRIVGKGSKEREVAIEGPVVNALREWLLVRDKTKNADHRRLFCSVAKGTRGMPSHTSAVELTVQRAAKAAGLNEWGVHRFRVTFATMLYDDNVDIERIRALMGHESIETTRRYLDVSERHRSVRLSSRHQHELLGTKPIGLPGWAAIATKGRGNQHDPS
jgi:site-specific recombinase XerD